MTVEAVETYVPASEMETDEIEATIATVSRLIDRFAIGKPETSIPVRLLAIRRHELQDELETRRAVA